MVETICFVVFTVLVPSVGGFTLTFPQVGFGCGFSAPQRACTLDRGWWRRSRNTVVPPTESRRSFAKIRRRSLKVFARRASRPGVKRGEEVYGFWCRILLHVVEKQLFVPAESLLYVPTQWKLNVAFSDEAGSYRNL